MRSRRRRDRAAASRAAGEDGCRRCPRIDCAGGELRRAAGSCVARGGRRLGHARDARRRRVPRRARRPEPDDLRRRRASSSATSRRSPTTTSPRRRTTPGVALDADELAALGLPENVSTAMFRSGVVESGPEDVRIVSDERERRRHPLGHGQLPPRRRHRRDHVRGAARSSRSTACSTGGSSPTSPLAVIDVTAAHNPLFTVGTPHARHARGRRRATSSPPSRRSRPTSRSHPPSTSSGTPRRCSRPCPRRSPSSPRPASPSRSTSMPTADVRGARAGAGRRLPRAVHDPAGAAAGRMPLRHRGRRPGRQRARVDHRDESPWSRSRRARRRSRCRRPRAWRTSRSRCSRSSTATSTPSRRTARSSSRSSATIRPDGSIAIQLK